LFCSKRCERTVWGSRDLLSGVNRLAVAHQSSFVIYDRNAATSQEMAESFVNETA
jgi:hypothetical protein